MNYLIINSHPYDESFTCHMIKEIYNILTEENIVTNINLIKDEFDPVMRPNDLKLWSIGQTESELILEYQNHIKNADVIIIPFPIWWGLPPAILKGFFDKVFLPNFAYKFNEHGQMEGNLFDKKAIVITTMETPKDIFNTYMNDPISGSILKNTLTKCGIEVMKYIQIDKITSGGKEYTTAVMDDVIKFFKNIK